MLRWRKVNGRRRRRRPTTRHRSVLHLHCLECEPRALTVPKLLEHGHARLLHHCRRPAHQHLPGGECQFPTTCVCVQQVEQTSTSSAGGGRWACTSSALTRPLSPLHVSPALLRMWCTVNRGSFAHLLLECGQLWKTMLRALTPPARHGTVCPPLSGCQRAATPASYRQRAS